MKTYPARNPVTASRVVDGEAVVVQADKGIVIVLNRVGSRIWELSDGSRDLDELARTISAEYEVSIREAGSHARDFVEDLLTRGLLVASDEVLEVAGGHLLEAVR